MSLTKTSDANGNVATLVAGGVRKFKMGIPAEAAAHIINRLTDLYAKPVDATVRETVSNAIDATMLVAEGSRRNIEVTLPTSLFPRFEIRDYGCGMSLDDVADYYSQYGATTKEKDFTQIGAHGLGCKAPLSYCYEYGMYTIKDGMRTDVTVSREIGENAVNVLSHEKSDEPNGTFVSVPVKEEDFGEFASIFENYDANTLIVNLVIDGQEKVKTGNYLHVSDFILDEETGLTGKLWVNLDKMSTQAVTNLNAHPTDHKKFIPMNVTYSLAGWNYTPPGSFVSSRWSMPSGVFTLELKPGIIDFSSSRDTILDNERSTNLSKRLHRYLQSEEGSKAILTSVKNHPYSDVKKFFGAFVPTAWHANLAMSQTRTEPTEARKVKFINSYVDCDEMTTSDGINPLKEILKPTKTPHLISGFVAIMETKPSRSRLKCSDLFRGPAARDSSSVALVRDALEHQFNRHDEESAKKPFVKGSLLLLDAHSNFKRNESNDDFGVYFVTGATLKDARSIFNKRFPLAHKYTSGIEVLFVTTVDDSDVKFAQALGHSTHVFTVAQMNEHIAEIKDEITKSAPKVDPNTTPSTASSSLATMAMNFRKFETIKGLPLGEHYAYPTAGQYGNYGGITLPATVTTDELIAENDIIFVSAFYKNEAIALLESAKNKGIDVEGKTVYLIHSTTSINKDTYDRLEGKTFIFDTKSTHRAASVVELMDKNRYTPVVPARPRLGAEKGNVFWGYIAGAIRLNGNISRIDNFNVFKMVRLALKRSTYKDKVESLPKQRSLQFIKEHNYHISEYDAKAYLTKEEMMLANAIIGYLSLMTHGYGHPQQSKEQADIKGDMIVFMVNACNAISNKAMYDRDPMFIAGRKQIVQDLTTIFNTLS